MKIRALAIDIDGTLTDKLRRLNFTAGELIRKLEARNVMVILATGNALCVADTISTFLGTSGALIAENGGIISYGDEVEYLASIDEIEKAYSFLKDRLAIREVTRNEYRKTEVALWRDYPVEEIKKILKDFRVEVVDTKFAIHIKNPDVSKGRALEMVARRAGISMQEVAAIGDSSNDIDMLEKAGLSISIGSYLKDVADYTTEREYGDGGVEALKIVMNHI